MTKSPINGPAEVTAIDTTARVPLLFLAGSGIAWLLVSGVLALITSIQLHAPQFLAECAWFTHGRVQAMRETAFIYGWAANAGIAVALWVLARLGGESLRALNWLIFGALFWNLGVTAGVVGIALGDMTGFGWMQLPRYVQPLLLFAYAAMAIPGVLAWTGRRHSQLYAAQWYALAALFLFPWLFTGAQAVLVWSPVQGTAQAIAAGWYAQSVWTLWLAPLALAGAYYLVPKTSGQVLPSYDFAGLGFWTLVFVGGWTGGRHLIGGPVPAWIASMGVAAGALLLGHYVIVFLNLRRVTAAEGNAVKFVRFGLAAYLVGGLIDAITAFRGIAEQTQFTLVAQAQQELALLGAVSMILIGSVYFMVPRLTGRPWASGALVSGHRALVSLGILLLVAALAFGGWRQGADLAHAETTFAQIQANLKPALLAATAAQALLLLANVLFFANFVRSACVLRSQPLGSSPFRQPAILEATAS